MAKRHDTQIKALTKKINHLKTTLGALGDGGALDDLLVIIHQPGWTTLRETAFSIALVDSLTVHARTMAKTHAALLKGARVKSTAE